MCCGLNILFNLVNIANIPIALMGIIATIDTVVMMIIGCLQATSKSCGVITDASGSVVVVGASVAATITIHIDHQERNERTKFQIRNTYMWLSTLRSLLL